MSVEGIGFDAEENEVTVVTATGEEAVPRGSKAEVAGAILDAVAELGARPSRPSPSEDRA